MQRINKNFARKITADDHIIDVLVSRPVWKGLLKLINALIYGLDQSYHSSNTSSGMASAFAVLEMAHTMYWEKEGPGGEESSHASVATPYSQGTASLSVLLISQTTFFIRLYPFWFE